MEKLLIEKRNQKIKEAEDAKIRELEKQKAEIEKVCFFHSLRKSHLETS